MSALQHIKDYLASKFAGHDIETLMTHFETAIEAKVEEGLADLKQEIAELRNEVVTLPPGITRASGPVPLPVIVSPDAVNLEPGGFTVTDQPAATMGATQ